MRAVGKRTRERAARICAMSASGSGFACYTSDVAEHIGLDERDVAVRLAADAIVFVEAYYVCLGRFGWHRENAAEAEALLRTGWSP